MGMYTEVYFRAELKAETPPEVIALLAAWVGGYADLLPLPEHEFFKCGRWASLPVGGSAYFPTGGSPTFSRSEYGGYWTLIFRSSLKNYDDEAAKFFDWIAPYLMASEGEFLGYTLYEEAETPTLVFQRKATQ